MGFEGGGIWKPASEHTAGADTTVSKRHRKRASHEFENARPRNVNDFRQRERFQTEALTF